MPLAKWVGGFLIEEGERLVRTAEEMRRQYVSHEARNILLRLAASRDRRGRQLIRIGSKGTNKEKQKARSTMLLAARRESHQPETRLKGR